VKTLWTLSASMVEANKKVLDKLTQMSRITKKSHRPRASHRMMAGT